MTKLLILDKDGTIVRSASGKEFIDEPKDQVLFPGVREKIENFLQTTGTYVTIATNQGGVVAGYKTLESAIEETVFCLELLDLPVFMALMCPDYEAKSAWSISKNGETKVFQANKDLIKTYGSPFFRKPGPGMMLLPMKLLRLNPEDCLVIGDRLEDEEAAKAAGMKFLNAGIWRGDS